ncbi:MAG: DNA-processing protein DprA [Spirochaetes bacterium]|jgi:predicted Rossmann fold nucleotide-binding protein DprA/Smf involved in DNA uptake|nr:DNA-processing protein DprA [Spirochaetota bacterium]
MKKYSYWIALNEAPGIGITALREIYESLLSTGLSIQDIMELNEQEIEAEFSFSKKIVQGIQKGRELLDSTEEVYHAVLDAGIEPVLFFEDSYPDQLKHGNAVASPPILYCFGNKNVLKKPTITLLGGSQISTTADTICYNSGRIMVEHNIIAGTGLNRGAGALFATGVLEARGSITAFIPCGLLTFNMSDRLKEVFDPDKSVIASPFFPHAEISKHNAIYRNELMSEISEAVYIVEMKKNDDVLEPTAKHITKCEIPLYTTEYSKYPDEASGNSDLFEMFGARPIRGKKTGNTLQPNLDSLIAHAKFN